MLKHQCVMISNFSMLQTNFEDIHLSLKSKEWNTKELLNSQKTLFVLKFLKFTKYRKQYIWPFQHCKYRYNLVYQQRNKWNIQEHLWWLLRTTRKVHIHLRNCKQIRELRIVRNDFCRHQYVEGNIHRHWKENVEWFNSEYVHFISQCLVCDQSAKIVVWLNSCQKIYFWVHCQMFVLDFKINLGLTSKSIWFGQPDYSLNGVGLTKCLIFYHIIPYWVYSRTSSIVDISLADSQGTEEYNCLK